MVIMSKALLVGARMHDDDGDGGVAQHGSHTPNNRVIARMDTPKYGETLRDT